MLLHMDKKKSFSLTKMLKLQCSLLDRISSSITYYLRAKVLV